MKTNSLILLLVISSFGSIAQTKVVTFTPLLNSDKEIVITNAEFSSIVGRALVFKDLDSGSRKAIDVTTVHPEVLVKLKINRDEAIAKQKSIEVEKKQVSEFYAQQGAYAASRARLEAIAAEERALKRRELDVQETVAKVQQLKIEEDRRQREERQRAAAAAANAAKQP